LCLPLEARLPQGCAHLDPQESSPTDRATQGGMRVQMALAFARRQDIHSLLVLDAFCALRAVFALANACGALVLEQIGHPQAVNALAPFANDPDPQVQKIATNATETCS
jgi:hypothetical protein